MISTIHGVLNLIIIFFIAKHIFISFKGDLRASVVTSKMVCILLFLEIAIGLMRLQFGDVLFNSIILILWWAIYRRDKKNLGDPFKKD